MKRLTEFVLALLFLLSVPACGRAETAEEPVAEGEYGIWFAVRSDSDRSNSFAIAREGRQWEEQPTAQQLLQALLDGPESDDLYAPFPNGVSIHSITEEEQTQTVRVDLSEQYGGLGGFHLTIADYCIALTLCQLPQVETVQITVEGKFIPYRDRQELQTGDVLLSGIAEEPDTFLAALYFPSRSGGALTVEYRQVTRTESSSAVAIVMAELLRGPSDSEKNAALPEGTQVRALSVEEGICQVDLSRSFLTNAPQEEGQAGLTLYALVNSLCALGGVSQVRLLVEGERVESYGGVSTGAPLSANFDLVDP